MSFHILQGLVNKLYLNFILKSIILPKDITFWYKVWLKGEFCGVKRFVHIVHIFISSHSIWLCQICPFTSLYVKMWCLFIKLLILWRKTRPRHSEETREGQTMPNMIPIQGPLVSQPPVQVPTSLVQEEEIEDERPIKNKPTLTNVCPHRPAKISFSSFLFFTLHIKFYTTHQILPRTDLEKDLKIIGLLFHHTLLQIKNNLLNF
jgi:hypothetical protein